MENSRTQSAQLSFSVGTRVWFHWFEDNMWYLVTVTRLHEGDALEVTFDNLEFGTHVMRAIFLRVVW